jgi:MOSC domain-containing protein YiiM/ferredoxin-NADP reductase
MGRLVSLNVGLPRDVEWRGKTVHTGIWKSPADGRRHVSRLNVEGDGQGDLLGHGGENRAVYVYQLGSYSYWESRLGRSDFTYGQFGENFTVEGLADDEVCIGDRFRIGTALFEVSQPRVTCYRLGIRMAEPRMPALLTSAGRPGFYFRVLEEGEIGAGDPIVRVSSDREHLTIVEANALLYLPPHPREALERALRIPALSPGWRGSFEALLAAQGSPAASRGNAGLVPAAAARTAAPGFRRLRVSRLAWECSDVLSVSLEPTDDVPLEVPLPGQFVVFRLRPDPGGSPLFRSYSLCGPPSATCYRLGVKVEPHGAAGQYLSTRIQTGDLLEVSAPRGAFVLAPGEGPVVLLSAGIGATPVLSMLHALGSGGSSREVWWLYGARDRRSHPFASESLQLTRALGRARSHIVYSRPAPGDEAGRDFDAAGRLGLSVLQKLGVPRDGDFYLCGPPSFLTDLRAGLTDSGIPPAQVHTEVFAGGDSVTPGIAAATHAPHLPPGRHGTGALVSFARSGIAVRWDPSRDRTLLELAEACDVSVRWSCRTGVCHTCECGLVSGRVIYTPEPLDPAAEGNALPCCAQPFEDVVLDL